jgi:hypothetical protein
MTPETLSAIAGMILSLILSTAPKVSDWYAGLTGVEKRVILLALLAAVGAGVVGLSCGATYFNILVPELPACTQAGLGQIVASIVAAFIGSQAAYLITPAKQVAQG